MKKKRSSVITIFIMLIIASIIIFGYYKVIKKDSDKKVESDYVSTRVETLLNRDLDSEYPPTAREVLKLYSRILVCLYGGDGEVSNELAEDLIDMIRKLYSESLLSDNPRDKHIEEAMAEIELYRQNERIIYDYQLEKANSAITWSDESGDYFRLIAAYSVKTSGRTSRIYQQFILIKEESVWKIHGWAIVDGEEMDTY